MEEAYKALIRRYIGEAYNKGNLAVIDEVYTADTIHYTPGSSAVPMRGTEALKEGVAAWRDAFPDFRVTLDGMIAEGDEVAYRWTARGTQRGEFLGTAPTGKEIMTTGMVFSRFTAGKIAEGWTSWDALA